MHTETGYRRGRFKCYEPNGKRKHEEIYIEARILVFYKVIFFGE